MGMKIWFTRETLSVEAGLTGNVCFLCVITSVDWSECICRYANMWLQLLIKYFQGHKSTKGYEVNIWQCGDCLIEGRHRVL